MIFTKSINLQLIMIKCWKNDICIIDTTAKKKMKCSIVIFFSLLLWFTLNHTHASNWWCFPIENLKTYIFNHFYHIENILGKNSEIIVIFRIEISISNEHRIRRFCTIFFSLRHSHIVHYMCRWRMKIVWNWTSKSL